MDYKEALHHKEVAKATVIHMFESMTDDISTIKEFAERLEEFHKAEVVKLKILHGKEEK